MNSSWFDDLTKTLATSTSRRQALKAIAATTMGGFLSFLGVENALAGSCTGPGPGQACASTKPHCCHGAICSGGTCVCPVGYTNCNGACVDLTTSNKNCGACGAVCPSGKTCTNGTCTGCASGLTNCNGNCVNLNNNNSDCGACGNICPHGTTCVNGACACASGFTNCNGTCVNLSKDANNCGTCGHACGAGEACRNGVCGCDTGMTNCHSTCVNVQTDPNNCGKCGHVCASGQVCTNGTCTGCPSGTTNCNGTCVNLNTDSNNCGSCGHTCVSGQMCSGGTCVSSCPSGQTLCGSMCVNLNTDPNNCGKCGNVCSSGVCSGGVCQAPTCNDGVQNGQETDVDCGGPVCPSCANGKKCNVGSDCQSGICTGGTCVTCPPGQVACNGGICTNVSTDPQNCGTCNHVCTNGPHASLTICSNGNCMVAVCDSGFFDCNNNPTDGCEVNITSDPNNCGACNHVCSFPNAVSGCSGGNCTIVACNAGFADCDGVTSNGCETNITSDSANCGACGMACPNGTHCQNSQCV